MGNQNQKREGTKKKRKDKKKKHHAYALIVLILAAAIIILGTVLLFYIQEVEVSGNEYCDSQEIVECVQKINCRRIPCMYWQSIRWAKERSRSAWIH